jgi:hypothetical protein
MNPVPSSCPASNPPHFAARLRLLPVGTFCCKPAGRAHQSRVPAAKKITPTPTSLFAHLPLGDLLAPRKMRPLYRKRHFSRRPYKRESSGTPRSADRGDARGRRVRPCASSFAVGRTAQLLRACCVTSGSAEMRNITTSAGATALMRTILFAQCAGGQNNALVWAPRGWVATGECD